jgi:glutaredoxin 3
MNGTPRHEGAPQPAIVMYVSGACSYCWRAKRLLDSKGLEFEQIDVTFDRSARAWLRQETGRRTVPQIKIGDRWIGGCDELHALDANGELDRILASDP